MNFTIAGREELVERQNVKTTKVESVAENDRVPKWHKA